MMNFDWTPHALDQMRARKITKQDVEVAVQNPDQVCHTPEDSWLYLRTMSNGRTLKVYVEDPLVNEVAIIRTAVWKGRQQSD